MQQKGIAVVHEEMQQCLIVVPAKLEKYGSRTSQFEQNCPLWIKAENVVWWIRGKKRATMISDAETIDIWECSLHLYEKAKWLTEIEEELDGIGMQKDPNWLG